jgi:hypothetical protein
VSGLERRWKILSLSTVAQLSRWMPVPVQNARAKMESKARELTQLQEPTNSIGRVPRYLCYVPKAMALPTLFLCCLE